MEERINFDTQTIRSLLYGIIDRIEFCELMERTPNCNDCGRLRDCEIAPEYGGRVRYNCHLWVRGE